MPNRDLSNIRNHYQKDELDWHKLDTNPLTALTQWLQEAISANLYEPTAMTLATVDAQHQPHARIVLLKGIDHGLLFYTNYASAKGQDITYNPKVAVTLFWPELERQIRVEGMIEKISTEASDLYFQSRPIDSQLAASISQQSQPIANREVLENAFVRAKEQATHHPIQRPQQWGGYRLVPHYFEFWQGRQNRLHDRLVWKMVNQQWVTERLAP